MTEVKRAKQIRMVCKEDQFTVIPISEHKRVLGRGEPRITWRHAFLHDAAGNPYCGKQLTDDDVEPGS